MIFGFGKKKPRPPPKDPLAAYDGLIEDLARQGGEVRKAAATLLSVRGELSRDVAKYQQRTQALNERLDEAMRSSDARASRTLERDLLDARELLISTEGALATAEGDAGLLLKTAEKLRARVVELRAERSSARARLSVGQAVSAALQAQVDQVDRVLALDAARDEVERAHALADIYREDAKE